MRAISVAERFWSHVRKTDDCWVWTGATRSGGYGVFRDGSRSVSAHRFAWEMQNGSIPSLMASDGTTVSWLVSHACGNRRCVRPEHLRVLPPVIAGEPPSESARDMATGRPDADPAGAAVPAVAGPSADPQLLRGLRTWQDSNDRGVRLSESLATSISALRSELGTLRGEQVEPVVAQEEAQAVYEAELGLSELPAISDAEGAAPARSQARR
jgi:hypothetical protein